MTAQSEWEALHQAQNWGKYPETDFLLTLSMLEWERPPVVLDAGCGNGATMWWAHRVGAEVYGIDFAPTAIDKTRTFLESEGYKPNLTVGDLTTLPYPDGKFDLVVDSFSLQCLPPEDVQVCLREVKRVLRPGGLLYTAWLDPESAKGKVAHQCLNLNDLAKLVSEHMRVFMADQSVRTFSVTGKMIIRNIVLAAKEG